MSFHSTHATSHALQPMHVVTSMYLQTSSSRCTPRPGTGPGCAEINLICSVPVGMDYAFFTGPTDGPLDFFKLHHESLELGCVRVGVHHRRRQQVDAVPCRSARVFRDAAIPPMNGDANLIRLLAVNHHRFDAPRH